MIHPESEERKRRGIEARKRTMKLKANLKRLCAELDATVAAAEAKPLRKGLKTGPRLELEARAEELFAQIKHFDGILA